MSELNYQACEVLQEPLALLQRYVDINFPNELPDVIIAGGAVRDLLLDRPVKDIDFITTALLTPVQMSSVFPDNGRFRYAISDALAEYKETSGIDGSSSLKYVLASEDNRINVLVVDSIEKKLKSFPDTISMVAFDGVVKPHPLFTLAVQTKTITLAERVRDTRLDRLRAKFPDYDFEVVNKDILQ